MLELDKLWLSSAFQHCLVKLSKFCRLLAIIIELFSNIDLIDIQISKAVMRINLVINVSIFRCLTNAYIILIHLIMWGRRVSDPIMDKNILALRNCPLFVINCAQNFKLILWCKIRRLFSSKVNLSSISNINQPILSQPDIFNLVAAVYSLLISNCLVFVTLWLFNFNRGIFARSFFNFQPLKANLRVRLESDLRLISILSRVATWVAITIINCDLRFDRLIMRRLRSTWLYLVQTAIFCQDNPLIDLLHADFLVDQELNELEFFASWLTGSWPLLERTIKLHWSISLGLFRTVAVNPI